MAVPPLPVVVFSLTRKAPACKHKARADRRGHNRGEYQFRANVYSVVKEQLAFLLDEANAGDTILTLEVSRLARSTKQLCDIIERVKDKRLRLSIVGSINVDCSNGELDPMTNAFIQMSGVFAELELRIIRERVRSGMRNARAKGAKIGRPQTTLDDIPANFLRHYPQYKKGVFNLTELARLCDISRTTAYKYIGLLEEKSTAAYH